MANIDDLFILEFRDNSSKSNFLKKIASYFIKFFNSHNRYLKLRFGNEHLNRMFGIEYTVKYDTKNNMLGPHNTLNIEQAVNIWHFLTQVILLNVPGDVVELGSCDGTGAMIMQKTLDQYGSDKALHVYDSFQGLPPKSIKDGHCPLMGEWFKIDEKVLVNNFIDRTIKLPNIHKGWFKDTLPKELPDKIGFAHLDSDLYSSIMESLVYIYPRLSKGGIVVIDDYCDPSVHDVNNMCPGVKVACDEFFRDKKEKVFVLWAGCQSHGYFRKE